MERITNDLRAGDACDLAPALRAKILGNTSGAEPEGAAPAEPEAEPAPPPLWRRQPLAVWGAAATVLLVWFVLSPVFMQTREKARQPGAALSESYARDYGRANKPGFDPAPSSGAPKAARRQIPTERVPAPTPAANGMAETESGMEPRRGADVALPAAPFSRRVHQEAEITVAVDKIEPKSEAVEQIVKAAGGFIAGNQLSTGEDNIKSASLTVRVPQPQFDATLRQIAKLGEVKAKDVTGEDITEQTSDAEQENHVLANEIRYKEARLQSRGPRTDTLSEQEAARSLRIELAQARARLDLLRKMAALSTITVQLREKPRTPAPSGGFLGEMGDTGRLAFNTFLQAARVPVVLLIWIAAYAPLWVPLALAYRYAARAQQRRARARDARERQAV